MKEIWKDIKDYEGLYQVSNLGRVKHLEFTRLNPLTGGISIIKEKILKQNLTSFGYLSVALYKNGNGTLFIDWLQTHLYQTQMIYQL